MYTKDIATNKKAYHDYFIEEKIEAGLVLTGTEVKSIRTGKISLKESFIKIKDGSVYLYNMHVPEYEKGNIFNHEPTRTRNLLLHRKEINKLEREIKLDGMTLIPLKVYFVGSKVKVEIGLAKGKKLHDKRNALKEKTVQRDIQRKVRG